MKQIMTAMLFVGMMSSMMAQRGQERSEMREKIEAEKIVFVTERAQLTKEESAAYWPMVEKMRVEMKAVKKDKRSLKKLEVDKMSEDDALAYLKNNLAEDQSKLDIKMKYHPEMIKAVGAKKLISVMQAERDFKREVLKDYRTDKREGTEHRKEGRKEMRKAPAPAK